MSKRGDFLDFTKQHTLTEDECTLVTFYRTLNKTKRQIVLQALFSVLMGDEMKKGNRKKKADSDN
jgi:hypothetical protein